MSKGPILVATSTDEYAGPYAEALRAVGVPEERIRTVGPATETPIGELASGAAGLLLCGGLDVEPWRYGEETLPDADVETSPDRDEVEWALLDAARERRLPVWAICRGFQVVNVYLGGTLWQDLPKQHPSAIHHSVTETPATLAHTVKLVEPGAPVAERLPDAARVNSRHHQALKRLGNGLVPVALSPDELVEAVYLDDKDWWVRGVQWHPENLIALPEQRSLWIDFVRAAGFEGAALP